ncbi:carbonic anhydrase [Nostoc sp. CENA543]|uniref:carbonic anhydrase n=1 Tax=Nostoc sp. CENA543 TaxID=1869241 RepID=UPI000CA19002|nr:carbonic anhydrase [Nostoc sp. CENA543]AUS99357.1 carbonic anhydrase [Nostoc sp. CENA543]
MERRDFLKLGVTGTLGMMVTAGDLLGQVKQAQAASPPASESLSADVALQKLLEGNRRFVERKPQYPDQYPTRLQELASAQHPFATILSCADSRVPPEMIFDQGLGDIFDVRVAGNISTPETLGSIEYAVAFLGTPLLMVMGHERCGAVTAAVRNESVPGDISSFIKAIKPAVARVKKKPGDAVENAVVANVQYQIERLKRSKVLSAQIKSGKLKVVGGRYDLDTGSVTIIA